MSDYYCDICDRTIKLKYKKKHLDNRLHRDLSTSVVNRYCVKNPTFLQMEDILKNTFMIIMKGLDFSLLYVIGNWILIIYFSV